MGINVRDAYAKASELNSYASELRRVRRNMEQYSSTLSGSWEGREVSYYLNAISSVDRKLGQVISELEGVGNEIVSTAEQIRREEEAERARREAEERARREAEERARREAEERAGRAGRSGS